MTRSGPDAVSGEEPRQARGGPHPLPSMAASIAADTETAISELQRRLPAQDLGLVFVFFSRRHRAEEVARLARAAWPDAVTLGCSTAGELGPLGMSRGGMSAFALSHPVRAALSWLPDLDNFSFEAGRGLVRQLAHRLGVGVEGLRADRHAFITLTDGLSTQSERLVAAIGDAAPTIPLVGGSAADDRALRETWTFADGVAGVGSAAVLLLEPGLPFVPFAVHHFTTTERRMVVTGVESSGRVVHEIDGWPAAQVWADLNGVALSDLDRGAVLPSALPRHFALSVAGKLYIRGVLAVRGHELVLGGAVEEGMVLHEAVADHILERTRVGLEQALAPLGGEIAGLLLFNCVGRLDQAQAHDIEDALWRAMSFVPAAGFHTYGEQFGPLQVNYTLTGLAFGGGVRRA